MGESSAIMRDPSGGVRLRCVKAGYNPLDLGTDRRFVTFDSAWANSFRVRASGQLSGTDLGGTRITGYGLGTAYRDVRILSMPGTNGPYRPTLAWQRNNGGTLSIFNGAGTTDTPLPYARGYGVCAVNLRDNEIYFSPSKPAHDYVYFVFDVNPTGWESVGAGGGLIGNHPTYGPGIYIARPGVSPLTASLDDMMLTSQRNHFQIAQTGLTGGSTHTVGNDPFPTHAASQTRAGFLVNLGRSYPDYPPVIAFPTDYQGGVGQLSHRHSCSIFWISPSQILILSSFGDAPIRWAIVGSDPGYAPGTGALVNRVAWIRGAGFYVTKKGIDISAAMPGDFLFRSDRQTPRFEGFDIIDAGAAAGTTAVAYPLPNPPAAGGLPFSFIIASDNLPYSGYWCGCGMVVTQDIIRVPPSPTLGSYYGPFFSGLVYTRNSYKWFRDAGYGISYVGYVATMNISDF